jgi:hypothetical protein
MTLFVESTLVLFCLISEGEEDVDQEQNTVDDCQNTFGVAGVLIITGQRSKKLSSIGVTPVFNDKNTRCNEHDCADQRIENIKTLVDRSTQQVSGEHADKNNSKSNESSVDQHNLMVSFDLAEAVVVKA